MTIAAGVAVDAGNNANLASTSIDNTVTFARAAIPTLSEWALLLTALLLAIVGAAHLRRRPQR